MKYLLVEEESSTGLEKVVNAHLADGWRPQGGVAVVRHDYEDRKGYQDTSWFYIQAIVKDEPST